MLKIPLYSACGAAIPQAFCQFRIAVGDRKISYRDQCYSLRRRMAWSYGVSAIALSAGGWPAAAQLPQGGVVVSGNVALHQSPNRLTVQQSSQRAVIDWRSFDVGARNQVHFAQPGATAATLNRVNGGAGSVIAGRITAPGTVIIQNNHGVVFTPGARVQTGGLVATTLTVDVNRFTATGGIAMQGGAAAGARVANQGEISVRDAGLVALVGPRAENGGVIQARRGTVVLASGSAATIDLAGDGVFRIVAEGNPANSQVSNSGAIAAEGGRVVLTAGAAAQALNGVINTSGVIRAGSARSAGGSIELLGRDAANVVVAGRLDTGGGSQGGRIDVTGGRVALTSTARLEAQGRQSGGRVRIGGDRQGAGTLRRAETVSVEQGATIVADGGSGPGGSVTVWAERTTQFNGQISAAGGSGGFVETSGREAIKIGSQASVDAGVGGHWLIDPRNVRIAAAGNTSPPSGGTINPPPTPATSDIAVASLVSALNGGSSVTITTNQLGADPGDITVASPVIWTSAASLTLRADRSVFLDADMRANGSGNLTVTALGGNVVATGAPSGNRVISTNAGTLTLEAPAGDVRLGRTVAAAVNNTQVFSASGALNISAGNNVLVFGSGGGGSWARVGTTGSSAALTIEARDIVFEGGTGSNSFAQANAGAGGSLTLRAGNAIRLISTPGGPVTVNAFNGATLTMIAPSQIWDGVVRSDGGSGGGTVQLGGAISASVAPRFALALGQDFGLGVLPGSGPSSYMSTTQPLYVGTLGTGSIDLRGPVTATKLGLYSHESIRVDAPVTATDPGTALRVAAGRSFINNAGSGALVTDDPKGRFLLYVDHLDSIVGPTPGPTNFPLYNRPFVTNPPSSLVGFAGNRIIYAEQPTLTLTGETLSKQYGTIGTPGVEVAGLRPGDTLGTALTAPPVVTSAGAPAPADVGAYPTMVAATASVQGYALSRVDGTLTVTPAPLGVSANPQTREYGLPDPTLTFNATGFLLGQTPATALTGALGRAPGQNVGSYLINQGDLAGRNYAISFTPNNLNITPALLSVTADDAIRLAGTPNPTFSATFNGFRLGDTPASLGGTLAFTTPATITSPFGDYPIMPAGVTSNNYAITFIDGTLTVLGGLPPVVPPTATIPNAAVPSDLIRDFVRGVPPNTPGDATFRTTVLLAPPVLEGPFVLTYSLGSVTQQAPAAAALAPAGFVPAAGVVAESAQEGGLPACGGPINAGPLSTGCSPTIQVESFWETRRAVAQ
jgi:filamentous hemagglutinin family protein